MNPQKSNTSASVSSDAAFKAIREGKAPIRLPGNNHYLSVFADELGGILAPHGFYNFNGICSTIEYNPKLKVYEVVRVMPATFRTIIEAHCVPYVVTKRDDQYIRFNKSLSADHARAILVSPNFLEKLPYLAALNFVRLPIRRDDGRIELLPEGYDYASGIFTILNGSSYDEKLPFHEAKAFIVELLSEVCFQPEDKTRGPAIVLAEMLTLFCTYMLPASAVRPGFLLSANAEGSGKTTLAYLAIIPRLGYAPAASAPKDEDEMRKEILAVALTAAPILFLDNVKHHIASSSLERLMTCPTIQGRMLGESREIIIPHSLTVIITGNGATISPDLRRRLRSVELFLSESKPEDHVFRNSLEIEDIIALSPRIRAALWAICRHWQEAGNPPPKRKLPSFSAWSETVAAIVECAGYDSPCLDSVALRCSGDRLGTDMQKLVEAMNPTHPYGFSELVDVALDKELFPTIIGIELPLDNKAKAAFGIMLKKNENRKFFIPDPQTGRPQSWQFTLQGNSRKLRRYALIQTTLAP